MTLGKHELMWSDGGPERIIPEISDGELLERQIKLRKQEQMLADKILELTGALENEENIFSRKYIRTKKKLTRTYWKMGDNHSAGASLKYDYPDQLQDIAKKEMDASIDNELQNMLEDDSKKKQLDKE